MECLIYKEHSSFEISRPNPECTAIAGRLIGPLRANCKSGPRRIHHLVRHIVIGVRILRSTYHDLSVTKIMGEAKRAAEHMETLDAITKFAKEGMAK